MWLVFWLDTGGLVVGYAVVKAVFAQFEVEQAARQGIEPQSPEPKSGVMPLDQRAKGDRDRTE